VYFYPEILTAGHLTKITKILSKILRASNFYLLLQPNKKWPVRPIKRRWQHLMIIVPIKDGENIERALKKFKRKFEKTGVIRELRDRKTFEKPSVKRRDEIKKAIYVKHLQINEE
jgi:small subunit ribosomal protein S21